MEKDLQKLVHKENMLKEGRIYWSNVNRTVNRPVSKAGAKRVNLRPGLRAKIKVRKIGRIQEREPPKPQKGIIERILFGKKR